MVRGVAVSGYGQSQAGMGIACGDLNQDGGLDLFVTDFFLEPNTFYTNLGDAYFEDTTPFSGVREPSLNVLSWGTQAVDFDLDGLLDLVIANGHIDNPEEAGVPWKMKPQLFRGRGGGRFSDASADSGPYFQDGYLGRGVARV